MNTPMRKLLLSAAAAALVAFAGVSLSGAPQTFTVKADIAGIQRAAGQATRISIPLPTGETVVARLTEYDARPDGFFTGGRLVADASDPAPDGEAGFTVVNGRMIGRIVSHNRLFVVRPTAQADTYAVTEVNNAQFPEEQPPVEVPAAPQADGARTADVQVGGDSTQFVDVLVVYTPAARVAMGGTSNMQLEVVGAIDIGNLALANGGVTHRFRLAHQTEISYVEAGSSDLSRLQDPDDGFMDEVHQLRDFYDADIVSFVGTSNACGLGYLMGASSISVSGFHQWAFNVNHYSCIFGNMTMAHEIGHNMGLHHDRANASSAPSRTYAYGYRTPGSRTVMAYDCESFSNPGYECRTRRAIFSTPDRNLPGVTPAAPAGVANSEDNARALNENATVLANLRDSTCSFVLSSATTSFSPSGGTGTFTLTTGSSCAWTAISSVPTTATLNVANPHSLGSRTLEFIVPANSASARSAIIYAGGQSITITQDGTCTPAVTISSQAFTRTGGSGTGTVTYTGGCTSTAWTTTSDSAHVTVTGGASSTGSGAFSFTVAANTGNSARSAVLTVAGTSFSITQTGTRLVPTPAALAFGATKAGAGGALVSVTDPQTLTLTYDGAASTSWTVAVNQPWLQLSTTSGTGSGTVTVSIINPSNVLGGLPSATGAVTITATNAGNSPITVPVTLTIDQTATATAGPFGAVDTPTNGATGLSGAIAFTGWALDDVGVDRVELWRNCIEAIDRARGACAAPAPGTAANFVFLGRAAFLSGARPDVETAWGNTPVSYRGGWGYLLLTNALPHQPTLQPTGGQGSFTLTAYAVDEEGRFATLGSRTVTIDNDNATTPFGAIDTPEQGGTVTQTLSANFGWAMTRRQNAAGVDVPKCIERSRYRVFINGVARTLTPGTNWFPNLSRGDLTAAYPGLCDSANALAAYYIDTVALGLPNGLHTIGWDVYDDNGTTGTQADDNVAGIGSRNFSVLIGSTDVAADRRMVEEGPPVSLGDVSEVHARAPEAHQMASRVMAGGRVTVDLGGAVQEGWQVVGRQLRALPPGSTLNAAEGTFAWQPPIAYFGDFNLVFVRGTERVELTLTVADPTTPGRTEIEIHSPLAGANPNPVLTVSGRAFDTQALAGSGVAAVHVWAYQRDVEGIAPFFLGEATLDGDRYTLRTAPVANGTYDIAVFAWNTRLAQWAPAAVVTIAVR